MKMVDWLGPLLTVINPSKPLKGGRIWLGTAGSRHPARAFGLRLAFTWHASAATLSQSPLSFDSGETYALNARGLSQHKLKRDF